MPTPGILAKAIAFEDGTEFPVMEDTELPVPGQTQVVGA
jgi:hypothetical protein